MIVGIDLGTTNSLIGMWGEGAAKLIPNALGSVLTPSCVSIADNGDLLVGQAARDRLLSDPERSAAAFKRYMGTSREVLLGKRKFRAEELSSFVLRSLKADAEAYLGTVVTQAVITVPAYFNDAQRKATRVAGEMAGLKVERLLNEPTAAALAYGLWDHQDGSKYLVIDLGGGTFDVSLLEVFAGIVEVRATAGDNYLGGEDFTDAIVGEFMRLAGQGLPVFESGHPFHATLRRQAELAKRALSDSDATEIAVPWKEALRSMTLTRDDFIVAADPLLRRIRQPIERAMRDARISPDQLQQVILAGGATRMPVIRKTIAVMFGRLPSGSIDPDQVVGMGAAVQAGLIMNDQALSEVVLTDVAPYTMGVAISRKMADGQYMEGLYDPLIERNTVIPASRDMRMVTRTDNQKIVTVGIYQGESRLVKDNIMLGSVTVGVPAKPAGQESVTVRLTYDVSGILEAEVKVDSTGLEKRLVLEGNPGVLTPVEIEKRLKEIAHIKIAPRDQEANCAIIARADRLYEESLSAARNEISRAVDQFMQVLESYDGPRIDLAREQLHEFLNRMEGPSYF